MRRRPPFRVPLRTTPTPDAQNDLSKGIWQGVDHSAETVPTPPAKCGARQQWFSSFGEFQRYLNDTPMTRNFYNPSSKRSDNGDEGWHGTKTWDEAVALARDGWHEGLEKIASMSRPIVETISTRIERADIFHDVEGMSVDIARFVEGEPECWQNQTHTIVEGRGNRVQRIFVNASTSGGVSTSSMIERGSYIAACVECLERAGFACEVVWAMGIGASFGNSKGPDGLINAYVTIKQPDAPLDMANLAFTLAHPAMFRRLGFAYIERQSELVSYVQDGSYGMSSVTFEQGDIYFREHFYGQNFGPATIAGILKRQGVTLTDMEHQ